VGANRQLHHPTPITARSVAPLEMRCSPGPGFPCSPVGAYLTVARRTKIYLRLVLVGRSAVLPQRARDSPDADRVHSPPMALQLGTSGDPATGHQSKFTNFRVPWIATRRSPRVVVGAIRTSARGRRVGNEIRGTPCRVTLTGRPSEQPVQNRSASS
jgi:hypothetical protein